MLRAVIEATQLCARPWTTGSLAPAQYVIVRLAHGEGAALALARHSSSAGKTTIARAAFSQLQCV